MGFQTRRTPTATDKAAVMRVQRKAGMSFAENVAMGPHDADDHAQCLAAFAAWIPLTTSPSCLSASASAALTGS